MLGLLVSGDTLFGTVEGFLPLSIAPTRALGFSAAGLSPGVILPLCAVLGFTAGLSAALAPGRACAFPAEDLSAGDILPLCSALGLMAGLSAALAFGRALGFPASDLEEGIAARSLAAGSIGLADSPAEAAAPALPERPSKPSAAEVADPADLPLGFTELKLEVVRAPSLT
jgi:hypothetical protein